jgi:putative chitinase
MSFGFDFTVDDLRLALPGIREADKWMASCVKLFPVYGITSKQRVAMFLAQTGHESGNWNLLEENLNYSAAALLRVFPKYYKTQAAANADARKPQQIANRVYASRMGNGDTASGDGYKYRGRGILQVTGKSNYAACSKALYGDDRLIPTPELLTTQDGAIGSACWYWNSRKLNAVSDRGDVVAATRLINGGTNGLDDRRSRYDRIIRLI